MRPAEGPALTRSGALQTARRPKARGLLAALASPRPPAAGTGGRSHGCHGRSGSGAHGAALAAAAAAARFGLLQSLAGSAPSARGGGGGGVAAARAAVRLDVLVGVVASARGGGGGGGAEAADVGVQQLELVERGCGTRRRERAGKRVCGKFGMRRFARVTASTAEGRRAAAARRPREMRA